MLPNWITNQDALMLGEPRTTNRNKHRASTVQVPIKARRNSEGEAKRGESKRAKKVKQMLTTFNYRRNRSKRARRNHS
jgi:hypothetical protein